MPQLSANNPITLGALARGSFDASYFGVSADALDEVALRIQSPASYKPAKFWAPGCVDCRFALDGQRWPGVCVAGGILTPVFGYIAGHGLRPGETMEQVVEKLVKLGFVPVIHEDCGALKSFMEIVRRLAAGDAAVDRLLVALGVKPDTGRLASMAASVPSTFVPDFGRLSALVRRHGGIVERFKGEHREVATALNLQKGVTFERHSLDGIAGDPRAFSLDAWALPQFAAKLSGDTANAGFVQMAMTALNAAVLLKLAGPRHKVILVTA